VLSFIGKDRGGCVRVLTATEDYLETILLISKEKSSIRAMDIVNHTGYARATVSIALRQLKESGYIVFDNSRFIQLTDKGNEIAMRTHARHTLIANFLIAIGVDSETAYADACILEHGISEESIEKLEQYYNQNFKP